MITTKNYSGNYKVEFNGNEFEIENMKEYGQDWTIRDSKGVWLNTFDTKSLCTEWIKRTY